MKAPRREQAREEEFEPPVPRWRPVPPSAADRGEVSSLTGLHAKEAANGTLFLEDVAKTDYDYDYDDDSKRFLEVYHFDGIPKVRDFPTSLRHAWSERLGVSPRDFFSTLFDTDKAKLGSGELTVERDGNDIRSLEVQMDLVSPESKRVMGRMDREFSFPDDGPPEVYHSLFDLDVAEQGKGIAKDLLANSVALYDAAGVKKVNVFAALGVGGYAWAKYGFKPKAGEETRKLCSTIGYRLKNLEGVPEPVQKVVNRLLASDDPKAIWAISDLDGIEVSHKGKQVPLGKALLMGTVWKGSLDLEDPQARARFDQYVQKSPAQDSPSAKTATTGER